MATPLADLIGQVINDTEAQSAFAAGPESFLEAHGYTDIDAADIREAFYILADGSPPAEAAGYVAAGDAIDELDTELQSGLGGAAAGLGVAVAIIMPVDLDLAEDPGALDGLDDTDDTDDTDDIDAFDETMSAASGGGIESDDDSEAAAGDPHDRTVDVDAVGDLDTDAARDVGADRFDADLDPEVGFVAAVIDLPDLSDTVDPMSIQAPDVDEPLDDGWGDVII